MKVNDENSRIRIQDPDPNLDPSVRGMDPRIRILIHPKMSWIRNTGLNILRKKNIFSLPPVSLTPVVSLEVSLEVLMTFEMFAKKFEMALMILFLKPEVKILVTLSL